MRVAVLGSTGSIGRSTLSVLESLSDRARLVGVTAHRSWRELAEISQRHRPDVAVLTDAAAAAEATAASAFPAETSLRTGAPAIADLARDPAVDVVIAGIVGAAGLHGTWAAIEAGKRVGVANKETLVVAGPLVMDLARRTGATLIPVDSEHSAIFQGLQAGRSHDVKRIVLTASGGPFRGYRYEQLKGVTPEQALAHPTWRMGPKITIDSATLMNKALEVIEARWLFGLSADQIEVVVHPQSIVHSFVEFVDGSVMAQLSPPDMRLPIQYALTYPERTAGPAAQMNWQQAFQLDFLPPDREQFPALNLGFEVAARGGSCGAVLNAANEVAVARFLDHQINFLDIPRACRDVLRAHSYNPQPTLDDLLAFDQWARKEMLVWTP